MLKLLIADGHEIVRRGLRALLEAQAGWSVWGETADGDEAVRLTEHLRPDVVLLSALLEGLNGVEATGRIRRLCPQVEVALLAPQHSQELWRAATRAGARAYVLLSDPSEDFVSAVTALAQRASYASRGVQANRQAPVARVLSPLTPREQEIVRHIAEAKRTSEIALRLGISKKTVESHRTAIMRKLGLRTLAEVVRYAVRAQLVAP